MPHPDVPRVRVVAEVGQCHEGDPDLAADLIDDYAAVGAWGVKLQLLDPDRLTHPSAVPYWATGRPHATQRDTFAAVPALTEATLADLVRHGRRAGVTVFATPFDAAAVALMRSVGMTVAKVASGDLTNGPLLDRIALADFDEIVVSSGASKAWEILHAVRRLGVGGSVVTVLACSLEYPTPVGRASLGRIPTLAAKLGPTVPVGYSDHTLDVDSVPFAAAALGATMLEKHATYPVGGPLVYASRRTGRRVPVPDHDMAVTPSKMADYVGAAQLGALAGAGALGVHYGEEAAAVGARRGVYAARDVAPGEAVEADRSVVVLRPAVDGGLGPMSLTAFGPPRFRFRVHLRAGAPVLLGDVERIEP